MEKTRTNQMDMTHGPLLKKLIIFTLPIMASSMLQLFFNAADVIVVGNFAGETSLAAVGSTSSLINLILNLFIGMSVGANVCAAQFFGAKHYDEVSKTLHTATAFSLICGIILIVLGNVLAHPMLVLMGSPDDVIDLATMYVKIYFIAMPGTMIYNFLSGILRASGDTKHPLYFISIAGVFNVLLNLVLVIVFNLGVAGVAIATMVASYLSSAMLLVFLMKQDGPLKLDWKKVGIDSKILKKIIRIGLPAGVQGMVFSFSNVVIQSAINSFGSAVVAGSAAASSIEGFIYMAMNSVSQTCVTFVGQNYGASDEKRVKKVVFECLGIVFIVGFVLGQLAYIYGWPLLSIYTDSEQAIEAGLIRMRWVCCSYFLCGIMDVMTGALRGIGRSTLPMIFSILGACVSRLIWIFSYFKFHHTESVLFFSYPGSWTLTIIAHVVCFILAYKAWIRHKNSGIYL